MEHVEENNFANVLSNISVFNFATMDISTIEHTIISISLDLFCRNFLRCAAEIWNTAGLYHICSKVYHYLHVTCNMSLACMSLKWACDYNKILTTDSQ